MEIRSCMLRGACGRVASSVSGLLLLTTALQLPFHSHAVLPSSPDVEPTHRVAVCYTGVDPRLLEVTRPGMRFHVVEAFGPGVSGTHCSAQPATITQPLGACGPRA
eukprot:scaffold1_cov402-Prasinococcus_capsulatus_cf.AAC.15